MPKWALYFNIKQKPETFHYDLRFTCFDCWFYLSAKLETQFYETKKNRQGLMSDIGELEAITIDSQSHPQSSQKKHWRRTEIWIPFYNKQTAIN